MPQRLYSGQEITIENALVIKKHHNSLKVSFLWGDDMISIVGPYQEKKNIFIFPPTDETINWHLKYCAKENIQNNCEKDCYIIIEEIVKKKAPYIIAKVVYGILIILSILLLFKNLFFEPDIVKLNFLNYFVIPIPIFTVLSFAYSLKK